MALPKNIKNLISFVLRFAISGGLLWYVFAKSESNMRQIPEILKSADLTYIFLAAGIFIFINIILIFRWLVFIKALDLSLPVKSVIVHYFYGLFGNLFLPTAIGGDLIKVIGLCKDSSEKPKIVASVLIDRLSGFASIVIVATVAYCFGHRLIGDNTLIIPILLMAGGIVGVTAVLFNEKIYSFGCRLFALFPRLQKALMTMHYDIALLKGAHKYKEGIKGILLACMSQMTFVVTFYFTARSLHQDVPLVYFFIFVPMICVVASFPSIGGLGFREWGAIELFKLVGVEPSIAVSMSLINFLFMIMVGLVGGFIYVYKLLGGWIQRYPSDAGSAETGKT